MDRSNVWNLTVVCMSLISAAACGAESGTEAITRPCDDRTLSFDNPPQMPRRIATMAVQDGDKVKVGQVLARQDTTVQEIEAEQLKATAEDRIRIDAQEAKLKQTQVDLRKFEEALKRGAATQLEVEHARLEVIIAELSLKLARFEQEQAKRKYRQKMSEIAQMELRSPIDGEVLAIYRRPGESADTPKGPEKKAPAKGVLRVVRNDPLWVDVDAPEAVAKRVKKGQYAKVEFRAAAGEGASRAPADEIEDGKIIYISSGTDSASGTRLVRLEVPNPGGRRPAGESVIVRFPREAKKAKPTAARGVEPSAGGSTKE